MVVLDESIGGVDCVIAIWVMKRESIWLKVDDEVSVEKSQL